MHAVYDYLNFGRPSHDFGVSTVRDCEILTILSHLLCNVQDSHNVCLMAQTLFNSIFE